MSEKEKENLKEFKGDEVIKLGFADDNGKEKVSTLDAEIRKIADADKAIKEWGDYRDKAVEAISKNFPELAVGTIAHAETGNFSVKFSRAVTTTFDSESLVKKFNDALKSGKITELPNYTKLTIDRKRLKDAVKNAGNYADDSEVEGDAGYKSIMSHSNKSISKNLQVKIEKKRRVENETD